jgi:hypothetical protein
MSLWQMNKIPDVDESLEITTFKKLDKMYEIGKLLKGSFTGAN